MKKLFALALSISAAGLTAIAAEPSFTTLEGGIYYGGFMPECVSPNGKYISGSTFMQAGFIGEWASQDFKVLLEDSGAAYEDTGCSLPYVNNDGMAVGFDDYGPLTVDANSGTIVRLSLSDLSKGVRGGLIDQMNDDGSIMVGLAYYSEKIYSDYGSEHFIETQAAYWENGQCNLLPVPTEEELGYYILGSRAIAISGDGNVILGYLTDRLFMRPMVLWYRQDDGSYKLDPVCMEYFSDIKYNAGEYKEYHLFRGTALSRDGKKVAMLLRKAAEVSATKTNPMVPAIYDVESGKITMANIEEGENNINDSYKYDMLSVGIANDGTMVGGAEDPSGMLYAFIMQPSDMTPKKLSSVFSSFGELEDFDDNGFSNVSCITPDGKYICGYGLTDNRTLNTAYFLGFVIDTGVEPSDDAVELIFTEEGEPEYYDIAGHRLSAPAKGLNIVRYPDGRSIKVIL